MHFTTTIYVAALAMARGIGKDFTDTFNDFLCRSLCAMRESLFLNQVRIYKVLKGEWFVGSESSIHNEVFPVLVLRLHIEGTEKLVS